MATSRLYELDQGATRLEISLDGVRVTQRRRSGDDEAWSSNTTAFTSHLEAREAFEQLAFVYGKRGRLLASEAESGAAQLEVEGDTRGAAEVIADWLLEEGPRLLGRELFELYRAGGLPLGFDGRTLVAATLANVSMPTAGRLASRFVHHPHFLMDALLARPISSTLTRLRFVERSREHDDEPGRMMPGELAAAVRAALRSPVGPRLEVLDAGDFEQPGEGKPQLKPIARCPALRELKLVFERGFSWESVATERLERLELGYFSTRTPLRPLFDATFPALETLSLGITRRAPVLDQISRLIDAARFPKLRRLAVHHKMLDGESDELAEGARALLTAIVEPTRFPHLRELTLGFFLDAGALLPLVPRLQRFERLTLDLFGDVEALRAELPALVVP